MIFEPQSYSLIFQDALYSMAVGFLAGFINRLLSCFLYGGKRRVFVKDIFVSFAFTFLLYSYCVSFANYGVLRWYNVAFALLGLVLFSPCFDARVRTVFRIINLALKHTAKAAAKYLNRKIHSIREKTSEKRQKIPQNNGEELLKESDKLLYN